MLPTPLISDWSSRARLTSLCLVRSLASTTSSSKADSIGSGAMCAMGAGSAAPPRSNSMWPNVRWSVNLSSGPESVNMYRIRTCGDTGIPGSLSSSWPLIPRWASSASSATEPDCSGATGSHRYLPRRRAPVITIPRAAASKSSRPARCRRMARGCSTSTEPIVRPTAPLPFPPSRRRAAGRGVPAGAAARPGTPGSVTVVVGAQRVFAVADGVPGGLGGLLLGFLLGAPLPGAVHVAADPDHGAEGLLVVGPALLDVVLRHAENPGSRQFLQR